jgi:5,6,7,8-tetrahydromethanopterin hydro-lyase
LCILVGVFIHWEAADDKKIYDYNYQATKESIARALGGKPTVSEVLSGSKTAKHPFSPK